MQRTSVSTFFKKYGIILSSITLIVLLAGCQSSSGSASSEGFFNHYFISPFSYLIKWIAANFNDDYGISVILITLAVRLILMPFMLMQLKKSYETQEKMKLFKPELDALQAKYKNKTDVESKQKQQQEMMELYRKHGMNPFSAMGCLPLLIQMPFLIGFYSAIRNTPEIATHDFLWFNLGTPDMALMVIAMLVYWLQYRVSQIGVDPARRQQARMIGIISPLMIGFISFSSPAVLPLYWAVGGLFVICQTLLAKFLFQRKK
ncbi:membrane protein insertase YidC [Terribacillus saccharophilus]|uniref:Membrane protein insertase YidC n=1 Tax=Terribacillus saccharophilus TaxID=361277 RepID=A0A075LG75_9BACI|nr:MULTISPECIES: membrane protein insertase YidC [Terribacillus]AIF65429.1 OxaA-like protein precursor [Terribacillus goriensis]MEC0284154.1 membrane protein insertase YidC [Terribacillus saccharophilus]MEC0289700.1 membrane protein insertase YidC [Terribacillus saccharophilus]MEC0301510.1 membrane protein insertase YidC [Terribacillus saccharophilus]